MGSLPMNFYFQIGPCRILALHPAPLYQDGHRQVGGEPAVDGGGVFLLSPPLCRASPLRVRVRAGRAGAGGEYFPELLRVKETKI